MYTTRPDPSPGAAQRDRRDDLSALAWVYDELRRSIESAHKALRRFVKESDAMGGSDVGAVDPLVLRTASNQFHQSVGALELVGLPAAATVLRASEAAVQHYIARPAKLKAKAVEDIEHASFALLDYLGRVLAGKPVSPLALFPQYRQVLEAIDAERVHPADLWEIDWRWRELPADPHATPLQPDAATGGVLEARLLPLMRDADAQGATERMSDLCADLGAGAQSTSVATLWKLAAAVFEAQAQGLLGFDVFNKRVASALLAQYRALERGDEQVSERLAQDLLFFCAQSASPGDGRKAPRLAAVRQAYGLVHHEPVDYATSPFGRFDPALVAQARKRVTAAKDAWSAVAGGEMHRMGGLSEQFSLVADSLKRLFPLGEVFAGELLQAVTQTQQTSAATAAPLAMEVATSLLYIEAALEDADFDNPEQAARVRRLAERLAGVRQSRPPQPLEGWMEELYRRVSDRQTMGSVVQELRASLSEAEKLIDQFFRQPDNRDVLIPVPQQLSSMRGVLSVLGMDHAASALLRMRDEVDGLVSTEIDLERIGQSGVFDRLAGNLGALGFLIDMLSVQPQVAKSLFVYNAEAGTLSPVMGREAKHVAVAAPPAAIAPAPAPVDERLIEQAQMLAFSAVREDVPVEDVARDLERLSQEAKAADQSELAATVLRAQEAFERSIGPADLAAARGELSEALVDYVQTATEPESVAPEVAAPTPAPVARVSAPITLDFAGAELEDDDEMRDVFLEEAREVLGDAIAARAELVRNSADLGLLTTLRRAFHTLKGSSRMVGLTDFGAAAWVCEQVYNTLLADQQPADPPLLSFTEWALRVLGEWVDDIASRRPARHSTASVEAAAARLSNPQAKVSEADSTVPPEAAAINLPTLEAPADALPPSTSAPIELRTLGFPADMPSAADLDLSLPVEAATTPVEPIFAETANAAEFDFEFDLASAESIEAVAPPESDAVRFDVNAPAKLAPLDLAPAESSEPSPAEAGDIPATEPMPLAEIIGTENAASAQEHFALDLDLDFDEPSSPESSAPTTAFADTGIEELDVPKTEAPESSDDFVLDLSGLADIPDAPGTPEEAFIPITEVAEESASRPEVDVVPEFEPPAIDASDAEATVAAEFDAEAPANDDELVKVVGPLRIGIPLFNIYLNEADELSRRLSTEVAEWAMELYRPIGEAPVALAHSLAGSSATVGFTELSQLARALEHAQARSNAIGHGTTEEAQLFIDAAEEVRRLLHQFAAGFLKEASPELLERLEAHERSSAVRLDAATAAADLSPEPSELDDLRPELELISLDTLPDTALQELVAEAEPIEAWLAEEPVLAEEVLAEQAAEEPPQVFEAAVDSDETLLEAVIEAAPVSEPEPEPEPEPEAVFEVAEQAATLPAQEIEADFEQFGLAQLKPLGALPVEALRAAPVHHEVDSSDDDIDAVDVVDEELFPIFSEEAEELLPQLSKQLREWARKPGDLGAPAACMRTLHTLKGGARLAGAMRLGEMAHRLESRIENVLAHPPVTAGDIDGLQAFGDALTQTFNALGARDDDAATVAEEALLVVAEAPVVLAPLPTVLEDAPAENVPDVVSASLDQPTSISTPKSDAPRADPDSIDWSRFAFDYLNATPRAPERSQSATQSSVRVRAPLLDRLVNQAGEVSITRSRIVSTVGQIKSSLGDLTENLERLRGHLRDIELQAETQISSRMEAAKAAAEAFDPLEIDRFTRFQELTRMMAESVNDVATVQRSLQRSLESTEDELAAQARLTRDLQDDLLRTRMVEFEGLSDRLYRVVRQAAKETGKSVRLDIIGGGVELDRGVLDRMTAAFEHLLRNCVAHGIELPDTRTAAGKDATGQVIVALSQEGNEVGIEFRDDGAGLNLQRIRAKGIAEGLLDPNASATDAELANLIFAPGFSTVEVVSELAGRGVGMDVVRAEVSAMGGRIETATAVGQGTSFKLILPLTTAVTQVVMLRCGETVIAVPSTLIEVVRRATPVEVAQAYASGSYLLGDRALQFFWLGALLQTSSLPAESAARMRTVVVVRSAQQRIALDVDEVMGNHEVVVKNLGPQLARLPGLAGVTLLASGAVALIYNPVALATLYGDNARAATQAALQVTSADLTPSVGPAALAPLVLVVDDSLTVRRVTQRMLLREGYRVVLAKDGLDALERLSEEIPEIVLSDIEMPRMDGFDLVRNMRADARLRDLPVIMITSRIAQKHRDYAAELGVNHYLGKPYSEEDLLVLIARYTDDRVTQM